MAQPGPCHCSANFHGLSDSQVALGQMREQTSWVASGAPLRKDRRFLDSSARQFFGSDGRDKSQRSGRGAEGMLSAWHEAVPALTKAFGEGTSSFMAALGRLPKAGPWALKEICSYLGVPTHSSYMAEEIPFGPGAEKGARLFLQLQDHFLDGTKALRKRLEDCMLQHFLGLKSKSDLDYLSVVDIEIFFCYDYSYGGRLAAPGARAGPGPETEARVLLGREKTWPVH